MDLHSLHSLQPRPTTITAQLMLPVLPDLEVTPLALTPRPSRLRLHTGIGTIWQGFLRDPAVSRLLIKLTGSDQNPLSFATVLLARYDIDGNKVFEKVR